MWVALYVVFRLVDWPAAQELWPMIFMNSLRPSGDREDFFTTSYLPVKDPFHPGLSGFHACFKFIQGCLWSICKQSEPQERDYHSLFNAFILAFGELLAVVNKKPHIVSFVKRSGQANAGTSQSKTTKRKNEAVQLRS